MEKVSEKPPNKNLTPSCTQAVPTGVTNQNHLQHSKIKKKKPPPSAVKCRFGDLCTTPSCKFQHEAKNIASNHCILGINCQKIHCKFLHPKQDPGPSTASSSNDKNQIDKDEHKNEDTNENLVKKDVEKVNKFEGKSWTNSKNMANPIETKNKDPSSSSNKKRSKNHGKTSNQFPLDKTIIIENSGNEINSSDPVSLADISLILRPSITGTGTAEKIARATTTSRPIIPQLFNNPSKIIQPPTFSSRKTELGYYRGCESTTTSINQNHNPKNSTRIFKNIPKNVQLLNQEENQVVNKHKSDMTLIHEEIESLKKAENFESGDEIHIGTLQALQSRLTELEKQLQVFHEMRKRAFDIFTGKNLQLQLRRELYRLKSKMPALAKRIEIEDYLQNNSSRFLIIQGQTGSGKSTQIAQYVADNPKFLGKKVICTQPRKIAAISLANRLSMEYSGGYAMSRPGYEIGYHVGGQKRGRKDTRIEFVTEGVMLDRIMKGSHEHFKDVGCIILDEAHERSIICDILLGSFKKDDPRWKDIQIIVTSATINLKEFSQFFNNAPTVEIAGKSFPIEHNYHPISENPDISIIRKEVVKLAIAIHESCKSTLGDILCFLPGQEDVLLAKEDFEIESRKFKNSEDVLKSEVFALFGRQDPEQQAEVFEKLPENMRKIIFATDVAETSITIDGVVYVVDSGVKKEIVFDPKRNISSLRINTISKSSAIQRAGRSGRTQPGECYRLYSKEDFETMKFNTEAEIFRRPLSLAILSLMEMNIVPQEFDWISAPSMEAIIAAEEELRYLGAVDHDKKPNQLGKLISEAQQDPRLVRMIYRGCQDGYGMAAITIASILTVSNIFFWNGMDKESKAVSRKNRNGFADVDGDVVTMYRLFQKYLEMREGKSEDVMVKKTKESDTKEQPDEPEIKDDINKSLMDENSESQKDPCVPLQPSPSPSQLDKTKEKNNNDDKNETKKLTNNELSKYRKLAGDWCRENSLNGKALGLVMSAKSELLSFFEKTEIWKRRISQSNEPTNLNLKRLVFSGYFLNTARLIHSRRCPQYFAIHSDVMGNLDYKAALLNHGKNSPGADASEISYPQWIVFEKILRISTTLFLTSTPIELSWIQEESPEFYDFCIAKSLTLPTVKIIKQTSQQCLRSIFGRYFCNMESLERELNCSLDVEIDTGILAAYCSPMQKTEIEASLSAKIARVLQVLTSEVIEEEYLGGTRLIIGQGYKVKEVLFPNEFTTLYIRRLHPSVKRKELYNFVFLALQNSFQYIQIRSLEVNELSNSATIKFFSKAEARLGFEILQNEFFRGQKLEIVPAGVGPKRGVTQAESCKLKISWAIGNSIGVAQICFTSATDANTFIDNAGFILPGARVTKVHGEFEKFRQSREANANNNIHRNNKKNFKALPPSTYIRGQPKGACTFRFVVEEDQQQGFDYDYKVTVVDIQRNIDEHEIKRRVKPRIPKWVKIERTADPAMFAQLNEVGVLPEEIKEKLKPLEEFTTPNTNTFHFFDRNLLRAGFYVYFDNALTVQKAFSKVDYSPAAGEMFQQPCRLEIAYNHSTSVNIDLYKFLEEDIKQIQDMAFKKGATCPPVRFPKHAKGKFVHLSFRTVDPKVIRQVQEKLEEISNYTKFHCENMDRLFTWTGRLQMEKLAEKAFIHCNDRNHGIWIYGGEEVQKEITTKLQKVASDLSKLEVFDKPFVFNKRKIDFVNKPNDKAKVERICTASEMEHYHFVRNQLFASGSKASINKLQEALEKSDLLFKKYPSKFANSRNRLECGVCICPPDGPFLTSSVCSHAFCIECIQPMFDMQPPSFPAKCPACPMELAIDDISKCAQKGALRKFVEVAAMEYQKEHTNVIFICPKPDCSQIISADCKKTGEYGGEFYFCDECVTTYCLPCSTKMGKAIKIHEFDSCEDTQNGPSDEVKEHVQKIHETIFNLSCPRCHTVFLEFDGCLAVSCGTCPCAFCGVCLKDCGSNAHSHAKTCSKNPRKGEYFCSDVELRQAHKEIRIEKLQEHLKNIEEETVKEEVLRRIRKDLIDLQIDTSQII